MHWSCMRIICVLFCFFFAYHWNVTKMKCLWMIFKELFKYYSWLYDDDGSLDHHTQTKSKKKSFITFSYCHLALWSVSLMVMGKNPSKKKRISFHHARFNFFLILLIKILMAIIIINIIVNDFAIYNAIGTITIWN